MKMTTTMTTTMKIMMTTLYDTTINAGESIPLDPSIDGNKIMDALEQQEQEKSQSDAETTASNG